MEIVSILGRFFLWLPLVMAKNIGLFGYTLYAYNMLKLKRNIYLFVL